MSVEVRGPSGNKVDVDSGGRALVRLPGAIADAPYTGLAGMADASGAIRIPISASTQGLLGTGQAFVDWEEGFAYSAVSVSKWTVPVTTMATAISNNALVLNSGNSVAASAVARISSWRTFECGRGTDRVKGWRVMLPTLVTGAVIEIGLVTCATTAAPTSGAFFRYNAAGVLAGVVISVTGAEIETGAIPTPALNEAHDYVIVVGKNVVYFQIDDVVVGAIDLGAIAPSPITSESSQATVRLYNAAATATAQQVHVYRSVAAYYGGNYGYDRTFLAALGGDIGAQGVVGASTAGTLANWPNSAAPASATLSNTAAGYTAVGGQFQFAAVAGAETDYALFAFQVPAHTAVIQGRTLIIHGVSIDTWVAGAAVGSATNLQWGLGFGSTAVSLATADAATTKSPRRVALGAQSFAAAAAIGTQANTVSRAFRQPVAVNQGEFIHVILKVPAGAATASLVFRGVVSIDATWE